MDLEKIIEQARLQQSWSANGKWNYGPIDYLKEKVVYQGETMEDFPKYLASIDVYERNVHRVTDAETYFVYCHKAFDIYVDADLMVCQMRKAFPEVSFKQVCEWLVKHEEKHQCTLGVSPALVPDEYKTA